MPYIESSHCSKMVVNSLYNGQYCRMVELGQMDLPRNKQNDSLLVPVVLERFLQTKVRFYWFMKEFD